MNAKDALRNSFDSGDFLVNMYLEDLSDSELLVRPVEGMNHIAWQLGHLICSERRFVEGIQPGVSPPLPDGFESQHKKETATSDDPKQFRTKAEYQTLWKAQREATKTVLAGLLDAKLDEPGPENMRRMAPTVGAGFSLMSTHATMHSGQFVAVRRKLGRPPIF